MKRRQLLKKVGIGAGTGIMLGGKTSASSMPKDEFKTIIESAYEKQKEAENRINQIIERSNADISSQRIGELKYRHGRGAWQQHLIKNNLPFTSKRFHFDLGPDQQDNDGVSTQKISDIQGTGVNAIISLVKSGVTYYVGITFRLYNDSYEDYSLLGCSPKGVKIH